MGIPSSCKHMTGYRSPLPHEILVETRNIFYDFIGEIAELDEEGKDQEMLPEGKRRKIKGGPPDGYIGYQQMRACKSHSSPFAPRSPLTQSRTVAVSA